MSIDTIPPYPILSQLLEILEMSQPISGLAFKTNKTARMSGDAEASDEYFRLKAISQAKEERFNPRYEID